MKTCMRYLAVVFAVAMIVCALSTVSAAFPDVATDNAHVAAIETMTNLGILGGYEDGTFRPDGLVRRDEMAKIIFVTATTYIDAGDGNVTFPDVAKNHWAKGYISWCAGKNIVGGYEDGTFRPEGNITYDEALKMVCAMLGYTDFSSEMWPIDVRTKGLIDLKLGTKLENIAGDAALTRAQVVQLVYNSIDKPVYQAPVEADNPLGAIILAPVTNLKDDVWNVSEIAAQIVGTENYGFIDDDKGIAGTKTGKEDVIQVRFVYEDGTAELKEIELKDIALEAYTGNTDSLITFNIAIITRGDEGKYIAANLKGIKKDVSGGYADRTGLSEADLIYNGADPYARYGVKIDGINYYNERFWNLRRLTYYDDVVIATNPHVDGSGNIVNEFRLLYSWNGKHSRWTESTFSFTQGFNKIQQGIDADSDGWIDYFIIEWHEFFRVKKVTSKTIEFEYLYVDQNANWRPVPAYKDILPAMDLVFPIENISSMTQLKVGSIIQGYQLGDYFTVVAEPNITEGYCIKYDASSKGFTLDNGSTVSGSYSNWKVWDSHSYTPTAIDNFYKSMNPLIGINGATGQYNYGRYYSIDGSLVYAEQIDPAADAGESSAKAILLYVTEPTVPQINEATKEFEVYYPAYIVINGRTQLVNLDKNYAINTFSGAVVSQDGSPYRARIEDDNGIGRVMYVNQLVTYSINSDGYYTLYTDASDIVDGETQETLEKVVAAGDYKLTIDKDTGIVSIKDANNNVVETRIIINEDTVLYYPYTKPSTGKHEYMDYYAYADIPTDFKPTAIRSNIFLSKDDETGLWVLSALVLDEELAGAAAITTDYTTDAREHLFAVLPTEAVLEGEEVYASYAFKNIYTLEDVTGYNKYATYDEATKAEANKIYAWDAENKNYVEVNDLHGYQSFKTDVVEELILNLDLIFTKLHFTDGIKIDDTVKLVALTDKETSELKAITIEELDSVLDTIALYNENVEDENDKMQLTAKIGTYEDDDVVKVAYILIDMVEYDEEQDAYFVAGEIVE